MEIILSIALEKRVYITQRGKRKIIIVTYRYVERHDDDFVIKAAG